MTDSEPQSEAPQDGGDRQRRLDALRDLARDVEPPNAALVPPSSFAAALPVAPYRKRRLALVSGIVALALVAVVAVGVVARGPLAALSGGHTVSSLTARIITLGDKSRLYCPSSPVWSPDGREIAVLAEISSSQGDCGNPSFGQSSLYSALYTSPPIPQYAIGIIDAVSGRVVRTVPFILPTLSALCGAQCAAQVYKTGVGLIDGNFNPLDAISWSPDGKTIGFFFTYSIIKSPVEVNGIQVNGAQWGGALLLIPVDGSSDPRTLLTNAFLQPGPDKPYPLKLFHTNPVYTWDLTTGAGSYSAIPDETGDATTPFAQAYGWTASGQIAPQASAGSTTFSPWVSGRLAVANKTSRVFQYTAPLWRWSPDGRYVAPNLTAQAYVRAAGVRDEPPAPTSGWYTPPLVTAPDPALSALLNEISRPEMSAEVAWSPNGALLASLDCSRGDDTARITVRRVSDGKGKLSATVSFTPTQYSTGCDGDMEALAWSADNRTIASADATTNELVLWRYQA